MNILRFLDLEFERLFQGSWQHGNAVFIALTVTNDDLVVMKINVLYPQTEGFKKPQT